MVSRCTLLTALCTVLEQYCQLGPSKPRTDPCRMQDNFYTATVYEKGAEIIRTYQTLLGKAGFRCVLPLQQHSKPKGAERGCQNVCACRSCSAGTFVLHVLHMLSRRFFSLLTSWQSSCADHCCCAGKAWTSTSSGTTAAQSPATTSGDPPSRAAAAVQRCQAVLEQ